MVPLNYQKVHLEIFHVENKLKKQFSTYSLSFYFSYFNGWHCSLRITKHNYTYLLKIKPMIKG